MKTTLSIVLLALLAAGLPLRAVPTAPKPPDLSAPVEKKESVGAGWSSNLESALSRAGREYQPILILFSSPGCGWCKRMKTEVFTDPDAAELLRHFVRVEIDVTQNEAAAFQLQVRGTPALRILDAAGQIQGAADGYVAVPAFIEFLRGALNPEFLAKAPESLAVQLKALEENRLEAEQWPALLLALGNKVTHKMVHDRVLKLNPPPGKALVAQLTNPRLAVRLAALELAEEIAGDDFGFDPWADSGVNREALARWNKWAEAPKAVPTGGTLGEEQIRVYLRDLASQDRERSTRALRMMQGGGAATLAALDDELEKNTQLTVAAKNRIREARYALVLPAIGKLEPLAIAHQLVFGNLDTRIQAITLLNGGGDSVLPVLKEFLDDGEPMVREATVDSLLSVAGESAAPLLETHLAREKDVNVVYAVLHGFLKTPCAKADEVLLRYLHDSKEDLAVAAIEGFSKSKKEGIEKELGACLADSRWRVRVAALETAGERKFKGMAAQVETAVDDPDAFVRTAAVQTLPKVGGSAKKLEEVFLRDDDLKPAVVKGMESLKKQIPQSFADALKTAKPEVIIGVIEAIGNADDLGVELIARQVNHPDRDVACTAVRMLAAKRLEKAGARGAILKVLQGGDREKILTALQAAKVQGSQLRAMRDALTNPERPQTGGVVANIVQAFGGGEKAPSATMTEITAAALKLFKETQDAEIRMNAALFLARGSQPEALKNLEARFESLTGRDRELLAEALSDGAGAAAAPILRRLLADPSEGVRKHAAEGCKDSSSDPALFALMFEMLLADERALKPADVWSYDLFSAMDREPFCTAASPLIRKLLEDKADPKVPTLGLLLLQQMWQKGDAEVVRPFLAASDPWQRRAAFQTLAWCEPELFLVELPRAAKDSSEAVLGIIPEAFARGDRERNRALDEEHSNRSGGNGRKRPKALAPDAEIFALLQSLTANPSNKVRVEAYFCLLSHRQAIDLNGLVATLNSFPERRVNDNRIARYLRSNYQQLGPEFAVLLPFLEASTRREDDEMRKVMKHFAPAAKARPDKFAFSVRKPASAPVLASYAENGVKKETATGDSPAARISAVFFYTPGCPDCERTEKLLAHLKARFPGLEVERENLRTVAAMRLNEALCERFSVPAPLRSVSPALFTGGGCLVKTELSFEKMSELFSQSAGLPDEWRKLPEAELTQAGAAIGDRYSGFSLSVVLLAGLLDGVNPCAFATLIFFISYLQVARRSPVQILQVGGAFIVGVFLAYFVLGLGLVEVVGRLSVLRGAGKILNGVLGLFALVIMAVSLRDGVLCLRGRMEETALQLPAFLKARIHGVIRTGTRHRRFVAAAFVCGIVVSFLELACTGQVYAPTILYMLKSGRAAALFYLGVYNLAFIVPLVGVFALAYAGVRSDALIRFQKRHAAFIKFATAALFLLLFLVLVRGW